MSYDLYVKFSTVVIWAIGLLVLDKGCRFFGQVNLLIFISIRRGEYVIDPMTLVMGVNMLIFTLTRT